MQIEQTFFNLASGHLDKNVLVICDRGALDPSACELYCELLSFMQFSQLKNGKNCLKLIIGRKSICGTSDTTTSFTWSGVDCMTSCKVSASNGAEEFYSLENNAARKEGLDLARKLDRRASEVSLD